MLFGRLNESGYPDVLLGYQRDNAFKFKPIYSHILIDSF